ncbi:MAG: hypothetical protein QW629_02215 [Candidatus Bathyarchaeia archaeon]
MTSLGSRAALKASAEGIYSVLKDGGKFIFYTLFPNLTKSDLKQLIGREWKKRKQFVINQPVEHNNMKIIHIEVANKTAEGILENNIYFIEKKGVLEAEITSILNPRIKWVLKDYLNVLTQSGFRKVNKIENEKDIIIIAIK